MSSASVGTNLGIVQTGDRARAFQGRPVPLGRPQEVPAPTPPLVGLPRRPVRAFVGRSDELARVSSMAMPGVVAVQGLGGVGKSELALQFAYARRDQYSVVWWVTADGPEAIESGLAELTYRLHPDGRIVATDQEAAGWALTWLQTHPGWLLVLDNVEHRRDVESLLGQLTGGSIIVTTRRDVGWEQITDDCLRVAVLAPDPATDLVLQVSGTRDAATATVLADELGYLPLALQQAAAYLRETRLDIATYLDDLRADPAGTLLTVSADDPAERAVARVWSVALTRIAQLSPLAIRVLQVLACFAPDDLPRDVLHHLGEERARVDQALGVLASYSMITLTGTTVSVHRLVQSVVAQRRDDETLRLARHALEEARPPGDASAQPDTWPRWAALSPHINALAAACPDEVGGADLAALLGQHSLFDQAQGRYQAKFDAEARALRIEEAVFGPDHPIVAVRLNNLSSAIVSLGRPAQAEPIQRRAVAITEKAFGPDHPDVAVGLNNLALTLLHLGRPAEAEPLQRRAITVTEKAHGGTHPDLAIRLGNLGTTLTFLGRPAEAEDLHRRALTLTEAGLGAGHPYVAIRLAGLAACLDAQGRVAESEPLRRRSLDVVEAVFPPEHPNIATATGNLAVNLDRQDRWAEAEPLHRKALTVAEQALGTNHPDTAAYLNNLAANLTRQGRLAEAVPLLRRALEVLRKLYGPRHPRVEAVSEGLTLLLRRAPGPAAD